MFGIRGRPGQVLGTCSLGKAHACVLGCGFGGRTEGRGCIYLNFKIHNGMVELLHNARILGLDPELGFLSLWSLARCPLSI